MKSRGTDYHSESEPLTIAVQTPSERRQQYVPSSASQTRYIISFLTFAVIVCGSVMIYLGVKLAHVEQSSEDHVQPFCPRDERATQGMVSTTHYLASEAGISILRQGGNAWDAAAAVQFMLNVVQPQSTGIGGGLFAMSYVAKNGTIWALDGREEAPERFNDTSFCANPDCRINAKCECTNAWPFDDRKTGGHPVGVPGTVAAIIRLHADFGSKKLSLSHLLQPAIDVAKNGFPMYQEMYDRLNLNRDRMIQFDATKKLFFNQKGDMPVDVGELFYNPDLAKTFELLAAEGEDVFYKGQLAHEIIDAATKAVNPKTNLSSVLSLTDFTGYRAVYREAIHTTYHNYHIYGMPMPSSGGVGIGMTLNMLSSWDISSMHPEDGEYMHRLIDVQDMMWADRHQYMGDADWIPVPTHGLINTSYATQRVRDLTRSVESARIHANGTIPYGNPLPYNTSSAWPYASGTPSPKQGTTHMVIVDRWGNVVSLTTTIEENFGSGVVVPNRGFLLNNELTDFEPLPKDPSTGKPYANGPEGGKRQRHTALGADSSSSGGKRPMSSMSPTIVLRNNKPCLAMGSPGGATIIGTVLNALMGVLAFDMCVADAIALPRLISQNNIAQAEPLVFNRTDAISLLSSRGFQLQKLQTARPLGYVEGVRIIDGVYYGGADTTRLGTAKAIGY